MVAVIPQDKPISLEKLMGYSQAQWAYTQPSVNTHSCIPFLSGHNHLRKNNPLRHCATSIDQDCARPEPHRTYYLGKLHPHRFLTFQFV